MGDLSKSKWSSTNFGYELWDKIEEDGLLLMSPPRTVVVCVGNAVDQLNFHFILSKIFIYCVFILCGMCKFYCVARGKSIVQWFHRILLGIYRLKTISSSVFVSVLLWIDKQRRRIHSTRITSIEWFIYWLFYLYIYNNSNSLNE